MKVNTEAMNRCYELMGRLNPDNWDIDTDGNLLTVKLRRISSGDLYIQFKGDTIKICKTNCIGRLIGSDTITDTRMTPSQFRGHLMEIWGNDAHIPDFDRVMLK